MRALLTHTTKTVAIACTTCLLLLAAACGGEEEGDISQDVHSSTAAVTSASGAATALATSLAPQAQKLYAQRATATDEQARTYAEAAFAAHDSCASFQWNGGLSGVVTFSGCELDATGQTIDGAVGISIKIKPQTVMTLTFTKLQVGGDTYDGSLKVTVSGAALSCTLTSTLSANMTYTSADGETAVTLQDVTVTRAGGTTTMDGKGSVTNDSVTTAFTAKGLTWVKGDCLPSSGTLTLTRGNTTAVITFLPTTPQTGVVSVQVGNLPAKEMKLFSPCGA